MKIDFCCGPAREFFEVEDEISTVVRQKGVRFYPACAFCRTEIETIPEPFEARLKAEKEKREAADHGH